MRLQDIYSVILLVKIVLVSYICQAQNNTSNCNNFFRGARRAGLNMAGRLEIPVDDEFPRFQLRLKFSRSIHHMTVRQLKARDVGSHTEFVVDPMEQHSDGMLRIETFIRLRHIFGPMPRLNRIVYNNRVLCGANLDPSEIDGSFVVSLSTSTTTRSRPISILTPTAKSPNKDQDDDEEVFE